MAWTKTPRNQGGIGSLKFPLLADVQHSICQARCCSIPCLTAPLTLPSQAYGVEKDADGDEGVALRATFIISDKGIIRHAEIADLPIGRNPEETVRLVQAFKFTDEHGQVSAAPHLQQSSRPCTAAAAADLMPGVPRIMEAR